MSTKPKKVVVFGTFDILHDGHRFFLRKARRHGDHFTVVVSPDEVVTLLKGRPPHQSLPLRMAAVQKEGLADRVIAGDREPESWQCLRALRPDIIVVGYDQGMLRNALLEVRKKGLFSFTLATTPPHEGHRYHTSIAHPPPSL